MEFDPDPDDEEDNLLRIRHPLYLGLALDGQGADETVDAWDGQESPQDAAEQGDDDGEHPETACSRPGRT